MAPSCKITNSQLNGKWETPIGLDIYTNILFAFVIKLCCTYLGPVVRKVGKSLSTG